MKAQLIGSPSFVRVAATIVGFIVTILAAAGWAGGGPLPGFLLVCGATGLLLLRTCFMGVWIDGDSLRIESWFRTYRIPFDQIERVTMERYTGIGGVNVGSIPLVGTVRVVALWLVGGKFRMYPSTVAPSSTTRRICLAIRQEVERQARSEGRTATS